MWKHRFGVHQSAFLQFVHKGFWRCLVPFPAVDIGNVGFIWTKILVKTCHIGRDCGIVNYYSEVESEGKIWSKRCQRLLIDTHQRTKMVPNVGGAIDLFLQYNNARVSMKCEWHTGDSLIKTYHGSFESIRTRWFDEFAVVDTQERFVLQWNDARLWLKFANPFWVDASQLVW